jgi:hypothetical protein
MIKILTFVKIGLQILGYEFCELSNLRILDFFLHTNPKFVNSTIGKIRSPKFVNPKNL